MWLKKQNKGELELLDKKIELKRRELNLVENEITLREKLSDVSKFSSLIEENNRLKKEVEFLTEEVKWGKQAIIHSIENGTNLVEKLR